MRRRTVLTTGTVAVSTLAGCASLLEGEGETNTDTPETEEPLQEPETPEQPVNETEEQTKEDPDKDQEKASSYTWEDILESEQEFYEKAVDQGLKEVVQLANNQDTVGESFEFTPESEKFEGALKGGIGYTHGGEYFDVNHFADADFEDALRDARTLTYLKLVEEKGRLSTSGAARTQGIAIEKLFENIRGEELSTAHFNDGHGFLPVVISPNQDPYTVDSTGDFVDKTWENPMSQRSGSSPINQFSEDKLGRDNLDQRIFTAEYQTMLTRLSDQPAGEGGTFVNQSLLMDANEQFSTESIPYNKIVPAIAVLNYHEAEVEPEKYHMLHADSWEQLPEFSHEKNDFQEYRKQIEDNIESFEDQEKALKFKYFEKEI